MDNGQGVGLQADTAADNDPLQCSPSSSTGDDACGDHVEPAGDVAVGAAVNGTVAGAVESTALDTGVVTEDEAAVVADTVAVVGAVGVPVGADTSGDVYVSDGTNGSHGDDGSEPHALLPALGEGIGHEPHPPLPPHAHGEVIDNEPHPLHGEGMDADMLGQLLLLQEMLMRNGLLDTDSEEDMMSDHSDAEAELGETRTFNQAKVSAAPAHVDTRAHPHHMRSACALWSRHSHHACLAADRAFVHTVLLTGYRSGSLPALYNVPVELLEVICTMCITLPHRAFPHTFFTSGSPTTMPNGDMVASHLGGSGVSVNTRAAVDRYLNGRGPARGQARGQARGKTDRRIQQVHAGDTNLKDKLVGVDEALNNGGGGVKPINQPGEPPWPPFVSRTPTASICVWGPEGDLRGEVPTPGRKPRGCAALDDTEFAFVDRTYGEHRIYIATPGAGIIAEAAMPGTTGLMNVAHIPQTNHIITANVDRSDLVVLDRQLNTLKVIDCPGGSADVVALSNGMFAVVKMRENSVCILKGVHKEDHTYNHAGETVRSFGKDVLQNPYGICEDHLGHVLVVDHKSTNAYVFSVEEGRLLAAIPLGVAPNMSNKGIACTRQGVLVVTANYDPGLTEF